MSTTGPVIWITLPVDSVATDMVGRSSVRSRQRACAPVAISIISRVMLVCRTLLYSSV